MAVFINYRREDSEGDARAIYNRLADETEKTNLFLDFEAINPGEDWRLRIDDMLNGVQAVIVVIGPNWLKILKEREALGAPDLVRSEIAASLKKTKVHVIPVLVKSAALPQSHELPADIRSLADRNAMEIRGAAWTADLDRLIIALRGASALPASRRAWIGRLLLGLAAVALVAGGIYFYNASRPLTPEQRTEQRCKEYANRAISDYNKLMSTQSCRPQNDARWQANFELHYGWCLRVSEAWSTREADARVSYLLSCENRSQ